MVTFANYRQQGPVDNSTTDDSVGEVVDPQRWRAGARTGYCQHGYSRCPGAPERGLAACLPSEHHWCAHGYDGSQVTRDGDPRCPWCRGVSRRDRNPETWQPPRRPYAQRDTPGSGL